MSRGDPAWRARRAMVRSQLIARGLTDRRTLAAMAVVPRHAFVPPTLAAAAYDDSPLPVGQHQTISQPYMVALMTAALKPRRTDRVLEIGTGSGYQTAVLAHMVRWVYTIERLPELARSARCRLEALGYRNVEHRLGDGSLGWPEAAPFDGILVSAAAPSIPELLIEQLAPGGRIAIPIGDLALQELVMGFREGDRLRTRTGSACRFVPLIGRFAFPDGVA